jgi:aerobic C4-dicarboxylate transport protein
MGIGRALTNLIGNCVATVAIARWEKDRPATREQGTFRSSGLYLPAAKTGRFGASAGILNQRRAAQLAGTPLLFDARERTVISSSTVTIQS